MRSNNLRGFTLIELLISLVLAMLLLNILIFLLLSSYKNLRQQFAEQQILTQAMEAERILRQDASMSGYLGCRHFSGVNGTDHSITFSFLSGAQFLAQPITNPLQAITLVTNLSTHAGDTAVIVDCQHTESFTIAAENQNNFSHPALQFSYAPTARLGLLAQHRYLTADTNRKYSNNDPISALYQDDSAHGKMELVSGIANLQIAYWQQANFVAADKVSDWHKIQKIRISFTSEAVSQKQIIRQLFTFDLALRNNAL